jgi:hypothetical protein
MPSRIAISLLTAFAVTLSFVLLLIAWIVPPAYCAVYRIKSLDDFRNFVPPITLFATDHSWLIALLLGAVLLASFLMIRRSPDRPIRCLTVGLCVQGLVAWLAMYCFFSNEFLGPISMHHDPAFDFGTFVAFGFGVFPITFILIIAPMIIALLPSKISRP